MAALYSEAAKIPIEPKSGVAIQQSVNIQPSQPTFFDTELKYQEKEADLPTEAASSGYRLIPLDLPEIPPSAL